MSEKENMLACRLYNAQDEELLQERLAARRLLHRLNQSSPEDTSARQEILKQLFAPESQIPHIEPPFYCDYGYNITFGKNVFINFGCTILDCASVHIGENTLIGPQVQIYTATHPLQPQKRLEGLEAAKGITIGKNVWIGGGAIILPGIWVGDNAVIGAGSVVTHDVQEGAVVAGNPAKVIRRFF